MKIVLLKISQNSQENTYARVSILTKFQASGNFFKKDTLAKMLSCGFYEIFKNTFFYRIPQVAASDTSPANLLLRCKLSPNSYSRFGQSTLTTLVVILISWRL